MNWKRRQQNRVWYPHSGRQHPCAKCSPDVAISHEIVMNYVSKIQNGQGMESSGYFPMMNSMSASVENEGTVSSWRIQSQEDSIWGHSWASGRRCGTGVHAQALKHFRIESHVTVTTDGYHYRDAFIRISGGRSDRANLCLLMSAAHHERPERGPRPHKLHALPDIWESRETGKEFWTCKETHFWKIRKRSHIHYHGPDTGPVLREPDHQEISCIPEEQVQDPGRTVEDIPLISQLFKEDLTVSKIHNIFMLKKQ